MWKKVQFILFFFSPVLLVAGIFLAKPRIAFADKSITVVLPAVHEEYDPSRIWVTDQWFVIQNLGITLLGQDKSRGFYGRAAKTWRLGKDGKEIEIELRKVYFSDGTAVTASAVAKSFKRLIITSSLGYHLKDIFLGAEKLKTIDQEIPGIEVLSESKLLFRFKSKFVNLLYFLSRVETSVLHSSQFDPKTLRVNNWNISSGPFTLIRSAPGLILKKNPHYGDGRNDYVGEIKIVGMQLNEGLKAIENEKVEVVNFGAVFSPDFKSLENSKKYHLLDFGQMSSCYFQFNEKKQDRLDLNLRRNLLKKMRSLDWKPYESETFLTTDQLLSNTMPFRISAAKIKEIESKWKGKEIPLKKKLRIFYPEFFGPDYRKLLERNFSKIGIPIEMKVVPIDKFLQEFNSGSWDILFTMMEMPAGDIRTLFTQLFEQGGMKLSDPKLLGDKYIRTVFSSDSKLEKSSRTLAEYIHEFALIIPLFQTKWPYYVKRDLEFIDHNPYELDFRLWKLQESKNTLK